MAKIKSFKEVLDVAIKDNSVKVLTILDEVLDSHTKQNFINKVIDTQANKIDNSQLEMEFQDCIEPRDRTLNEHINHLYGTTYPTDTTLEDDAKFCAHI